METPEIKDWHAHVYFDAATRDTAWSLREKIEKSFEINMGRFHERAVRAADLLADAEPRRSHRVHPSQHRPGPRGSSRPRGVDRQVGAAGPEHLHRQEEGLSKWNRFCPWPSASARNSRRAKRRSASRSPRQAAWSPPCYSPYPAPRPISWAAPWSIRGRPARPS